MGLKCQRDHPLVVKVVNQLGPWIGQIPRWPESLGAFEAKDLMGRHEGQVKRVSERPGQDLGDGECLDDRALHGMRDGLQRGHRALEHGEHLERHRALMHGGHAFPSRWSRTSSGRSSRC